MRQSGSLTVRVDERRRGDNREHNLTGKKLRTAFALTAIILLIELAGGVASHSLALLSDAGHVLTDIFALGLAWFATLQAGRPADANKTYGCHRTGILAAVSQRHGRQRHG
jgi:cobalt-zinc-cadmium efflux system protein